VQASADVRLLAINAIFSSSHSAEPLHGCAPGADTLAEEWAIERRISYSRHQADWDNLTTPGAVIKYRKDGKPYNAAAGGVRNQQMIDDAAPDGVVAFPGGDGTAD